MEKVKKVAPKPKKEKAKPKPKVDLVSYSIKMVIPTGQYANIQPEIIVKTKNVEDAHDFIAPHMNKLWKEYYLINERRVEPDPKPVTPTPVVPVATVEPSPVSSVALTKATQAVESCMSLEALDLIAKQVEKSVKLTNEDKDKLIPMMSDKFDKLSEIK